MTLPVASPDGLPFLQAALILHISGGAVGLVSGFLAVAAPKGRPLHRKAGTVFVVAMLVMAVFAVIVAVNRGQSLNILAGSFTLYMVASAWLTVRRRNGRIGRAEAFGCLYAFGVAATAAFFASRDAGPDGVPDQAVWILGGVAAFAATLDLKVIIARGVAGASRISRHLWRMCAALFIASGSFFLGQMDEIPQALRGPHLIVLALAPLAALLFWMVRVRFIRAAKSVPVTP